MHVPGSIFRWLFSGKKTPFGRRAAARRPEGPSYLRTNITVQVSLNVSQCFRRASFDLRFLGADLRFLGADGHPQKPFLSLDVGSRPLLGLYVGFRPLLGLYVGFRLLLGLYVGFRPLLGLYVGCRRCHTAVRKT